MTFLDFLTAHGVPHVTDGHEHCRPGWVQLDCPLCCGRNAGRWRLGWNLAYNYANCWACGRVDRVMAVASLTGLDFNTIKSALAAMPRGRELDPELKRTGRLKLPEGREPLLLPHYRYLEGRGYRNVKELVRLWGIEGIGLKSLAYAWRIFIPIYSNDEVVSWTTRSISDTHARRYRTAPAADEAVSCKKLLYGADYARAAVIVVEGPLDVWRIGPGAVATLGTAITQAQIRQLANFPSRAICFDNEPAAQTRARRLSDALAGLPGETVNVVLDAKDAGSATDEEVQELRRAFLTAGVVGRGPRAGAGFGGR